MAQVAFEGITKRFGATLALDDLSCVAPDRGFTVFVGPPGAGKSLLLRMLVGLETPDAGRVMIDGRDVTDDAPAARPVGYVPQSFALYPHLTVRRNIGYPLRLSGASADRIAAQVNKAAALLSIGHLLDKTPDQLSGGEKQRVAVARGLSKDAKIFVLDDPLVGLDYKLRERLMGDLKALRAELDATFLYAASDPLEALTMARDMVVIEGGRLVQAGPVDVVYDRPQNAAAMRLVGFPRANLTPGTWRDGVVEAGPLRFAASEPGDGRSILVGARPEAFGPEGSVSVEGSVALVEDLGGEVVTYLDCAGAALTVAAGADAAPDRPALGSTLRLAAAPRDLLVFDARDGALLARGRD
jgi:multiple sugar transport system ATP-binding protein